MNFDDWITEEVKRVLLIEPNFPIPNKSRNHSNFLPIGLLKIAGYLRTKSIDVKLVRYEEDDSKKKYDNYVQTTLIPEDNKVDEDDEFKPDLICVTSIFTYWSKYVKSAVDYCKRKYVIIKLSIRPVDA